MCGCTVVLQEASKVTACQCLAAGYCTRHQCDKPEYMHELCRSDPRYFQLWEEGRGPFQDHTMKLARGRIGLGDILAKLIHVATLGYVKPCARCNKRRQKMNQWLTLPLPKWAARWFQV